MGTTYAIRLRDRWMPCIEYHRVERTLSIRNKRDSEVLSAVVITTTAFWQVRCTSEVSIYYSKLDSSLIKNKPSPPYITDKSTTAKVTPLLSRAVMMTPRRTLETSMSFDDKHTSTEEYLICREHVGEDGAANLQLA